MIYSYFDVVDDPNIYRIHTFDDGNQTCATYTNEWKITHVWKGKVRVENLSNANVDIPCISRWKLYQKEEEEKNESSSAL